jgi:hypothetical protein
VRANRANSGTSDDPLDDNEQDDAEEDLQEDEEDEAESLLEFFDALTVAPVSPASPRRLSISAPVSCVAWMEVTSINQVRERYFVFTIACNTPTTVLLSSVSFFEIFEQDIKSQVATLGLDLYVAERLSPLELSRRAIHRVVRSLPEDRVEVLRESGIPTTEILKDFSPSLDSPTKKSLILSPARQGGRLLAGVIKHPLNTTKQIATLSTKGAFLSAKGVKAVVQHPLGSSIHVAKGIRSGVKSVGRKISGYKKPFNRPVLLEGACARAISETHWTEEWLSLLDEELHFYDRRTMKSLRIATKGVVSCAACDSTETSNMPGLEFFKIETLGREFYVMVKDLRERETWISTIRSVISRQKKDCIDLSELSLDEEVEEREKEETAVGFGWLGYVHKSTMFKKKSRLILNCRTFAFDSKEKLDPLKLVDDALRSFDGCSSSDVLLMEFLNKTAMLKNVDINSIEVDSGARLCFLLNLFHLMVNHSMMLVGEERVAKKFFAHMNTVCYQVGGDVFSLLELEQNIIRAGLSIPNRSPVKLGGKIKSGISAAFARGWKQSSSVYSFALTQLRDYRVNLALNFGSVSNLGFVPIYVLGRLDEQLQKVAMDYCRTICLTRSVKRKHGKGLKNLTYIPVMLRWYREDFKEIDGGEETDQGGGGGGGEGEVGDNNDLLRIVYGLRGEELIFNDTDRHKIQMLPYVFQYRILEVRDGY